MGAPVLELRGIQKRFPGVHALRGVHLALRAGEVLALLGENGAGKSTLMKIVGGVDQPDAGDILVDGTRVVMRDVQTAIALGIAFIHQELNLLDNLDVAGNILLGFGSRLVNRTGNLAKLFPKTFVSFFAGFAGVSGFPPFGIFISELLIIMGAFQAGRFAVMAAFIFCLILVFAGAARIVMRISFTSTNADILVEERFFRVLPSYALLLTSIVLFIWMPDTIYETILNTIKVLGGSIHG
jgi:ABC-type sugar transport system ATPase subunit